MGKQTMPSSVQEAFPDLRGELIRYLDFPSRFVAPRHVDVWLPPSYHRFPRRRYPVIYMQDGQNLFNPATSFLGIDWGVDETISRMEEEEQVSAIVVAIWNSPQRILEYMPLRPLELMPRRKAIQRFEARFGQKPLSDAYLRFLTEEVKPFIDTHYRTLPEAQHTFVMGSSMGGLLSLYALCEYPHVFGGSASLSTSWTVAGRLIIPYVRMILPRAGQHRLYFDYGIEARMARYETYQREVGRIALRKGYVRGVDLLIERFPGAEHSESAWRARVDIPLRFLLRPIR